jgi:hypothetical protein
MSSGQGLRSQEGEDYVLFAEAPMSTSYIRNPTHGGDAISARSSSPRRAKDLGRISAGKPGGLVGGLLSINGLEIDMFLLMNTIRENTKLRLRRRSREGGCGV